MKSTEVYALLRSQLGPSLKALGFKRQVSFLSWSRPRDGLNTVLWCQVSRDGWDEYAGSKFVVELQRSEEPEPGSPSEQRKRLSRLVGDEEREEIRKLQNEVIKSLHRAPPTHARLNVSPEVTRWYLQKFVQDTEPYGPEDDLWFRYAQPVHVQRWGELLVRLMPTLLPGIESIVAT